MLILSRRVAECVCLGDDIVLTVVAVGNDKVRIGVEAPAGVRILRNELELVPKASLPSIPPTLEIASVIPLHEAPPALPVAGGGVVESSSPTSHGRNLEEQVDSPLILPAARPVVSGAPLRAVMRQVNANRRAA